MNNREYLQIAALPRIDLVFDIPETDSDLDFCAVMKSILFEVRTLAAFVDDKRVTLDQAQTAIEDHTFKLLILDLLHDTAAIRRMGTDTPQGLKAVDADVNRRADQFIAGLISFDEAINLIAMG